MYPEDQLREQIAQADADGEELCREIAKLKAANASLLAELAALREAMGPVIAEVRRVIDGTRKLSDEWRFHLTHTDEPLSFDLHDARAAVAAFDREGEK